MCDHFILMNDGTLIEETLDNTLDEIKEPYVLMQYTGLKDMNGDEIYEGDIVQEMFIDDDGDGGVNVFNEWLQKVVFREGHFCFDRNSSLIVTNANHIRIAVVGNIYENADLLE